MAQQAPKVAKGVGELLFNNLKSKDFREYLMRYVGNTSGDKNIM